MQRRQQLWGKHKAELGAQVGANPTSQIEPKHFVSMGNQPDAAECQGTKPVFPLAKGCQIWVG